MSKKIIFIMSTLFFLNSQAAFARMNIVVSYPYIKDITEKIGIDKVEIFAFARGDLDPHFIVPRPSYISRAAKADLLIINGAELETGWIPPIINQASNNRIMPGGNGLLDLSRYIKLQEIPSGVSRSGGDVHPSGNPHFLLDPANIPVIASAIAEKLSALDPANSAFYHKNFEEFSTKWKIKEKEWEEKMKPLKGARVIEYHKLYFYLTNRYGLTIVGDMEPLPGIPPSSRHIEDMIGLTKTENVRFILQDVYHPNGASKYVSEKSRVKMIVIPHDVGAVSVAKDIFSLYDEIIGRFTR
jgi:zinc/manganese transport system substrate-binding protein